MYNYNYYKTSWFCSLKINHRYIKKYLETSRISVYATNTCSKTVKRGINNNK